MRDIAEVVKQKQSQLQELQREMQRVEGQLEVLQSALRVIEEDDLASTGPVRPEPKLRRWPEAVSSSSEKSAAGDRPASQKQFP